MEVSLNATSTNATHMLFVGDGWVEATRVWIDMPHAEVDGAESGWGWHFSDPAACVRWLQS